MPLLQEVVGLFFDVQAQRVAGVDVLHAELRIGHTESGASRSVGSFAMALESVILPSRDGPFTGGQALSSGDSPRKEFVKVRRQMSPGFLPSGAAMKPMRTLSGMLVVIASLFAAGTFARRSRFV